MPRESACNAKCSAATTRTVARSRSMAQCHFARAPPHPRPCPPSSVSCALAPTLTIYPHLALSGDERAIPHPPSSLLLSARGFALSLVPCCVFCISPLSSFSAPFALSLFRSARVMSRYYVTHSLSAVDSTSGGSFGSLFSLSFFLFYASAV